MNWHRLGRMAGVDTLWVGPVDHHPWVVRVGSVGLTAAVLLVVFGLPPIDIHAPTHYLGLMAPTCGLTRAVVAAARVEVARSLAFNPLGVVLVAGAVVGTARHLVGLATGRWLNLHRHPRWPVGALAAGAVAALAVLQQSRADLLLSR